MKCFNLKSSLLAGLVATAAMTILTVVAPMMGMPKMDIPGMLSGFMGTGRMVGWGAHLMVGLVLAIGFGLFFYERLQFNSAIRGAMFAMIPWLMAQLVMMPMMGMGLFSGSMLMAGGSLMGHLVYGMVLGAIYRPRTSSEDGECVPHGSSAQGSVIKL